MNYDDWRTSVDIMLRKELKLTIDDLPDPRWRELYDVGNTPKGAIRQFLHHYARDHKVIRDLDYVKVTISHGRWLSWLCFMGCVI